MTTSSREELIKVAIVDKALKAYRSAEAERAREDEREIAKRKLEAAKVLAAFLKETFGLEILDIELNAISDLEIQEGIFLRAYEAGGIRVYKLCPACKEVIYFTAYIPQNPLYTIGQALENKESGWVHHNCRVPHVYPAPEPPDVLARLKDILREIMKIEE